MDRDAIDGSSPGIIPGSDAQDRAFREVRATTAPSTAAAQTDASGYQWSWYCARCDTRSARTTRRRTTATEWARGHDLDHHTR